jgi:tRNA G26 N,N-dimethylase Trm1
MKWYVESKLLGTFEIHGVQALRLVLHAISTSAARYGRYIHPVLSLSIDFYVRMFVRVHAAPIEVKKAYRCVLLYFSPCVTICVVLMA